MPTKLTYTGAEVQELLDKIEKGDFDNAKTLEGHPASYFAIASEFTSLAESFATEQGRVNTLYSYFNNGSANDALSLGGKLPSYYATATQYEILQRTLSDFKSLFDSMFEKDSDGNIHAKLSLWSSGGITAGGVGSGGSGGGISYNRLDAWSDYSADKSGWVLSALLGKDLDNRVSALANAGYITASYLAPYALRSEIPSLEPYFLSSNFTKSNIKATLGISDWALASVKPTYTASEVGALGVKDTAQQSYGLRHSTTPISDTGLHWWSGQFQVSTEPVSGKVYLGSSGDYTVISVPDIDGTSSLANACVLRLGYNRQFFHEIFTSPNSNNIYHRNVRIGNGNPWRKFAFTTDLPTKLSDLTDDVVAGKYLSLAGGTVNGSITATSFIGNLTGNADSADFVAKTYANENINFARDESKIRLVSGIASNSTDLGFPKQYTAGLSVVSSYCGWQMVCYGSNIDYNPYYRSVTDKGVWGSWRQIAFLTDNVASATKLATPRTIWGQSFDGTGDITGPLHLGNNISIRCYSTSGSKISTLILDPSNTLLLGYDMSNIGGTVLYGKALAMRYGTSRTMGFLLNEYGNVAIGGATADEKLHVHGNGKFTGALTANSLTIGGVTLTYDSVNEALCINGNMYALGGITAGGAGISAYTSLEARVARIEQQLNVL